MIQKLSIIKIIPPCASDICGQCGVDTPRSLKIIHARLRAKPVKGRQRFLLSFSKLPKTHDVRKQEDSTSTVVADTRTEKTRENVSENHQLSTSYREQPLEFKPLFDNPNKANNTMLSSSGESKSVKSTLPVGSRTNDKQSVSLPACVSRHFVPCFFCFTLCQGLLVYA